jgi:hypothetical protein
MKKVNTILFYAAFSLICMLFSHTAEATHIRSADIKVTPDCARPRTFTITIVAYLNTLSNTRFGTNSQVFFGDGTSVRIPVTTATIRPDLGTNIAVATFTTTHTYSQDGTYTIAYVERDRSSGIVNIVNSADVPYVTFVEFVIDSNIGCNTVPILFVPPLDRACLQSAFFHSPGAYDVEGDSLSSELSIPASGVTTLADYTAPNNSKFYLNFSQGNEDGNGVPVFSMNPVNGLLTWDAPGTIGEYNIAFKIIEWRKDSVTNVYRKLSTTTRDMQILVEECTGIRPELSVPEDICVEAGTLIEELIQGIDGDKDKVKIEVFSEIIDFDPDNNPATYTPRPPDFISSDPAAELRLRWQTDCMHVRQQPYQVVFKITDSPPKGPKLVNFKIWNIKVVAPAPEWNNLELDLVKRNGELEWESYACTNASKIQIWRKVDSYPYAPGLCNPGLPKFLGYNLIAEVPTTQTAYTDTNNGNGLVVGAKYCYRIIAYFNSPASTPSLVSTEVCIGPIEADAPVITHVSVEKTDSLQGKIRVSWRSPFNINSTQFPEPYEYEVYRADDFIGDTGIIKAGRVSDTTFVDSGINTDQEVFNYRIVLYAKPDNATEMVAVDTSSVASSERLSFIAGVKKIELAWRDSVPWSNVSQSRPYHLIYRSVESPLEKDMVLIDSVKVSENGFTYVDAGQFQNQALEDDKRYSYRILTRGTYGNPKIALQENFSQIITTYPYSKLLPCVQALEIKTVNCDEFLNASNCYQSEFSNNISWTLKDQSGCRKDIVSYKIYAASSTDGDYSYVTKVENDTFFIEGGLPSFARCYRVSAIDALGQEGPLSDSVCNDNCPYYDLPNVFTPNEDGYNDAFSANFDVKEIQDGTATSGVTIRCPRFVLSIDFKVFNRWGKQVYTYASDDENAISIDWDGHDSNGHELSSGVYFYTADVSFNVMRPESKRRQLNGWVHLVR